MQLNRTQDTKTNTRRKQCSYNLFNQHIKCTTKTYGLSSHFYFWCFVRKNVKFDVLFDFLATISLLFPNEQTINTNWYHWLFQSLNSSLPEFAVQYQSKYNTVIFHIGFNPFEMFDCFKLNCITFPLRLLGNFVLCSFCSYHKYKWKQFLYTRPSKKKQIYEKIYRCQKLQWLFMNCQWNDVSLWYECDIWKSCSELKM